MKLIAYSFSELGGKLGDELQSIEELNLTHRRSSEIGKKVSQDLKDTFYEYDGLIFIGATGIAVRLIAPFIKHKIKDPAILCIDDKKRYVISLLSGHLGGANELTNLVAEKIGATPIITTASDSRGIESIDMFAKRFDYHMQNMQMITEVTRQMVDGEKIYFYSEDIDKNIINYDNLVIVDNINKIDKNSSNIKGAILVSSELLNIEDYPNFPVAILRPKNINIGIGSRKDIDGEKVINAIKDLFKELNISTKSINSFGTVEVKKNEKGILEAVKYFDSKIKIFSLEEIKKVDYKFNKSEFVKKTIGVYSVAEPSAYLLGGEFISMRTTHDGITLSVTREAY